MSEFGVTGSPEGPSVLISYAQIRFVIETLYQKGFCVVPNNEVTEAGALTTTQVEELFNLEAG
jgi:hypothetical protein